MPIKRKKTVRELRLEKAWEQSELSKRTGLSVTTISEIENHKTSPRPATRAKLASALGVEPADIAF